MWIIIKTELAYYKTLLVILYGIVTPFLVANAMREDFAEQLARVMFITVPIMGIVMNIEEKKSRKNPLYVKLPVPLRQIGIARQAVWLTFWLSLVALFAISSWIGYRDKGDATLPWFILTIMSAIIVLVTSVTIIQDLRFCIRRMALNRVFAAGLLFIPLIAALIYLVVTVSTPVGVYLAGIFLTPSGSICLSLLAGGLLVLSVVVFAHRKSYLE